MLRCEGSLGFINPVNMRADLPDFGVPRVQSPAFNNNPLLEIADFNAPTPYTNIATYLGPMTAAPPVVQFQVKPSAAMMLKNNREMQFRLVARYPDGTYFTNHDDQ